MNITTKPLIKIAMLLASNGKAGLEEFLFIINKGWMLKFLNTC
jgi:hypothetical protein